MSDYIPIELVAEILKWLPVKTLMRFRCVSKKWDSLISSSNFITLHLNRSAISDFTDSAETLVRRYSPYRKSEIYSIHSDNDRFEENFQEIEFPFKGHSRYCFRIVGSCNGIVCLSNDDMSRYANRIILWNPSIRRYLSVPGQCSRNENNGDNEVCVYGFGIVSKTNGLKVVNLRYIRQGGFSVSSGAEVYEVGWRGWRKVQAAIPYCILDKFWSCAHINGVCHWIAYHINEENGVRSFRSLIMSFDFHKEEFGELNLPKSLRAISPLNLTIAMFGGFLTVFRYDLRMRMWSNSCSIWVMKEYGNDQAWSNQFNVDLVGRLDGRLGMVLSLRQDGDILLAATGGKLLSYNQRTRMCKNIGVCGTSDSFYVDKYKESLVLLKEGRPVSERDARLREPAEESGLEDDLYQLTRDALDTLRQVSVHRFFSALSRSH